MKTRLRPIKLDQAISDKYLLFSRHDSEKIDRAIYSGGPFPECHPNYTPFNLEEVFSKRQLELKQTINVELCCGTGDFLVNCALLKPNETFIGVDYARPVIERAARLAAEQQLKNILFYSGRIEDFFGWDFKDRKFAGIFLNFPDPWPKKKHHKRRILQAVLAQSIADHLLENSFFISATDVLELHQSHLEALSPVKALASMSLQESEKPSEFYEKVSTYEKKGRLASRGVYYTKHQKVSFND